MPAKRCTGCGIRDKPKGRSYCQPCNTIRVAEWRAKNPERRRRNSVAWAKKKKKEIIEHYGGKCACCGESEIAFLTIDHKFNNGNAERRKYKSQTWKLVIKRGFPDDYQILCYNCNNAKQHYGVCPHGEN